MHRFLLFVACALATFGFLAPAAVAQTVHAGADTDTKIYIGQPNYQHEVIEDHHTGWLYTEANAHSWLPGVSNWAAQAEAHAQRFHLDLPWPIPDIQWTNCWTRCQLRDGCNPKNAAAKASAWGSWFIVDGPPGVTAELRARIPSVDNVPDVIPPDHFPYQGMCCDSFFDIFTEVSMSVDSPSVGLRDLLAIRNQLGGSASPSPGLTFSEGDWAQAYFAEEDEYLPDGSCRKKATIIEDILSPVTVEVPTNTPFHVDWLVSIEVPERECNEELTGEIMAGASLFVQLELVDSSGNSGCDLRAVPEPGTPSLLLLGAVATFVFRRRSR